MALREELWAWGANDHGQLGVGDCDDRKVPTQAAISEEDRTFIDPTDRVTAIDGGGGHALVVLGSGTVLGCGWDADGQLGLGGMSPTEDRINQPVLRVLRPLVGVHITAVACGWAHSLARSADGRGWGWGCNRYGQLGMSPPSQVPLEPPAEFARSAERSASAEPPKAIFHPEPIPFFDQQKPLKAVCCGMRHSVVLVADTRGVNGVIPFGFGSNRHGQLGEPPRREPCQGPRQIAVGFKCTQIAAGANHTAFVSRDGAVFCCGANKHGQCGVSDNSDGEHSSTRTCRSNHVWPPRHVIGIQGAREVACGWTHTVVTLSDASVVSFGRSNWGQLGTSSESVDTEGFVALNIRRGHAVSEVRIGSEHGVCKCEDGGLLAWGWNEHGMLGTDSTEEFSAIPLPVDSLPVQNINTIGCGGGFTMISLNSEK